MTASPPPHADAARRARALLVAARDAGRAQPAAAVLDDATRLAARAAAAEVAVALDVTPGVPHVFQAAAPELNEADAAVARTGAFLRAQLHTTG